MPAIGTVTLRVSAGSIIDIDNCRPTTAAGSLVDVAIFAEEARVKPIMTLGTGYFDAIGKNRRDH